MELQPIEESTVEAELPRGWEQPVLWDRSRCSWHWVRYWARSLQAGGAGQFTSWESTARTEDFQVFVFLMSMVWPLRYHWMNFQGGIHRLEEVNHIIGKPAWYLGLQTNRDSQLDVVDTAKWWWPRSCIDEYKENYQYSDAWKTWGLASTRA